MIIHCPSCANAKAKIQHIAEGDFVDPYRKVTIKCKEMTALCKPCPKPLTSGDETHFAVRVNVESL